ncbi:MAG: DNA/RNA nuclease SfsA [Desulfocapsaceae bacterium]|jgi:sugar fermentation stimulation protein A|nr:DNA/RNA nuclease SfsA [Desulfocapsaceae bacterium]
MQFASTLKKATLIRRYKRFLADVRCPDGSEMTIHCPNSGSMRSCSDPGSSICYSTSDNPKRKYPHTLEMIQVSNTWVGVNTMRTNQIVSEAFSGGIISEYRTFDTLQQEVKTSEGNRLDLLLISADQKIYIEIKSSTLVQDNCAQFPDAVTTRGTKHLRELIRLAEQGHTAVIFYLVQRGDAERFEPAAAIDPQYTRTLVEAQQSGVRILVYQADVTPRSIEVVRPLPFTVPDIGTL